ncbi:MAG: 16S rRNA (uracil(1498)-N(3))-methyltransferase [Pseudomonadota bacterium]
MAIHDFSAQRLFVDADLARDATVTCQPQQTNYLINVLRLKPGNNILVFNGRDGEWKCEIVTASKRSCELRARELVRAQPQPVHLRYCFAPLKRARLDYMVQKAVELGATQLCPVITRHTIAAKVNLDRMRANAIEAAEQCGILHLPSIAEPVKLPALMTQLHPTEALIYCDEHAPIEDALAALAAIPNSPTAVLIGPEGGFSPDERKLLLAAPYTTAISLGPRIMRADTAAVAALTLVNAVRGDWSTTP